MQTRIVTSAISWVIAIAIMWPIQHFSPWLIWAIMIDMFYIAGTHLRKGDRR